MLVSYIVWQQFRPYTDDSKMVKLHVKRADESLFLYETTVKANLNDIITDIARIQNQRLKIERLYYGRLNYRFFMA